LIYNLPHDDGEGVLWWYPEAVTVPNFSICNGGATALFDSSNAACNGGGINHCGLPALIELGIPGDYNRNGLVDAGDYTIWRDTLGSTTDLRADGDDSGTVDLLDYNYWASHFGAGGGAAPGAGAAASSNGAIPEPPTWVLALGAAAIMGGTRRYRWSQFA
jgi:hypothetical protein